MLALQRSSLFGDGLIKDILDCFWGNFNLDTIACEYILYNSQH